MARNTNLNEILFPVEEHRVYLQGHSKPIHGYKAIIGILGKDLNKTFSIVSDEYKLIHNNEAIEVGKEIHLKLFPRASSDSFEIFNIIVPDTKSFCQIDIIDKNYTLNIWKKEVYVPFIRIHNSYNKSRSLKFEIGFCRKLCNNGVIYEKNTVSLKFAHTKKQIIFADLSKIDVSYLHKVEHDFIAKTKLSESTKLPHEYFLPLAAKLLNRHFNLNETDPVKLSLTLQKKNLFSQAINEYADRYINESRFGETAYAFFNVITDYASNGDQIKASAINGLQTKCGIWINQLAELITKPDFSWKNEIKDFEYLLN